MKKIFPALLILCYVFSNMYSQTSDSMSALYSASKYDECISLADKKLKLDENDNNAHFMTGLAYLELNKYKRAEKHLLKAKENGFQPIYLVNPRILRALAGQENTEELYSLLEKMVANGFATPSLLEKSEFKYIQEDLKFQKLYDRVFKAAYPCKFDDKFKKLDFWTGQWDVYVNGLKSAESTITKSQSGCLLYEDYKSSGDYTGNSTNYFDTTDSLYKQVWIDKFNTRIDFFEIDSGEGFLLYQSGKGDTISHMSYTLNKDNTVTQSWETTNDGGDTWVNIFKGVYRIKSE